MFGDSTITDLSVHHPSPVGIFWLWQTYLENVNPAVKILHVPTVQQLVLEATADVSKLSPSKEALVFSIYLSALSSIPECDHAEGQRIMGEPINVLRERFTGLMRQALINAKFLRSFSLTTLQAYVSFLVSLAVLQVFLLFGFHLG